MLYYSRPSQQKNVDFIFLVQPYKHFTYEWEHDKISGNWAQRLTVIGEKFHLMLSKWVDLLNGHSDQIKLKQT